MLKLMFNSNDGGFHNFQEEEVESMKLLGWVDGEPIRAAYLDAKRKDAAKSVTIRLPDRPVASSVESATLHAQSEVKRSAGRPRKEAPSIVNDREV